MLAEIYLPTAAAMVTAEPGAGGTAKLLGKDTVITDWTAFSGDYVHKGQLLGHAEIDGLATDIVAPATGVLRILAPVDRPLPTIGPAGVIDTAPDARSFTLTFTPTPSTEEGAMPTPANLEWTVDLPPVTPWSADSPSAFSSPTSPRELGASAAAVSAQRLSPSPNRLMRDWDRRPPLSGGQDTPRPLAVRRPLLNRHIAASDTIPNPDASLSVEPPTEVRVETSSGMSTENQAGTPVETPVEMQAARPLETPSEPAPAYPQPRERLYASPRARALARLMGVDVISVKGTGPFGRVEEGDVRQFLAAGRQTTLPATPPAGSEPAFPVEADVTIVIETTAILITEDPASAAPCEPLPTESKTITSAGEPAEPTAEGVAPTETAASEAAPTNVQPETSAPRARSSPALRESDSGQSQPLWQPTATISVQMDATNLMLMRERLTAGIQKRTGEPLSLSVLVAKLVALALRDHPVLNARQTGPGIEIMPTVDIGIVRETLTGEVALVLTDTVGKDLLTLSREAALPPGGATLGMGIPTDAQPTTFTIVNLGEQGADICMPAVPHSHCAALGLGCLAPRPVVLEGQVVVRPTVFLSLAYHASAISAHEAAAFLKRLATLAEEPTPLAERLIL